MSNLNIIIIIDALICLTLFWGFFYKISRLIESGRATNTDLVVAAKYIFFTAFVCSTFISEYAMYSLKITLAPGWLFNFMLITKGILGAFTIISVLDASGYLFGDNPSPN